MDEHRRLRLVDLVREKFDGNEQLLGRALGYADGSFVRQMMRKGPSGRKITEKTIRKIESIPGLRGWFTPVSKNNNPSSSELTVIRLSARDVHSVPLLTFEQLGLMETTSSDPRLAAAPRIAVLDTTGVRAKAVVVNDDAMATLISAGNLIHLDPDLVPRAGDTVLVVDDHETYYIREYRVRTAGAFEATPSNAAYATLHSLTHGLRVVAVATHVTQSLRAGGRA